MDIILSRLFPQAVLKLIVADKLADEVAFLVTKRFLQQIAGPRLVLFQQGRYKVRNVHLFGTAAHHLQAG